MGLHDLHDSHASLEERELRSANPEKLKR